MNPLAPQTAFELWTLWLKKTDRNWGRGSASPVFGLASFCAAAASRCQSSGEPESRGIIPGKRASVILKSPYRRRMYRRAAPSDSAATGQTPTP
jgi:hypothetical protein